MARNVTVIDHGLCNLFSIRRALEHIGGTVEVATTRDAVLRAERLVLPGVGAFGDGMAALARMDLVDAIHEVAAAGRPVLGVCLGMQLLFTESEEFGLHQGLDLIPGRVVRLHDRSPEGAAVKVPHVGWAGLRPVGAPSRWRAGLLGGIQPGDAMYFVHSYAPIPAATGVVLAEIVYGGHPYSAVVRWANVGGAQCHPEKSGEVGLRLLRNFLEDGTGGEGSSWPRA